MKQPFLLALMWSLLLISNAVAQDFDSELESLAKDLASKIGVKGKKRIAVWGFVTEGGERTALADFLTEDFSVYMTNFADNFEIIDRKHLDILLEEHKLNSEGYIDSKTAKELQKIIAVDAIVTGTYTVLNTTIKVRAKALDTETALQFAANMSNLTINENVGSYLGISINGGNTTNRGFNTPLSSNETINNPETINPNCKKMEIGDFCFSNALNEKVIIRIKYYTNHTTSIQNSHKTIVLDSNESKCLYGLPNRKFSYFIATWKNYIDEEKFKGYESALSNGKYSKFLIDKGELKVETCKSKTYTIK